MKKLMFFAILFTVGIGSTNATVTKNNKDIVGEWKYEVPSAPYGYEKGSLIFAEKDGKLTGEVKFVDGYKIELKDVTYENGILKCNLSVEYTRVDIAATVNGEKMAGTVKSTEGNMKMTAKKVK